MRSIVVVKGNRDDEAGVSPNKRLPAAMGQYNDELAKAGIPVSAEGLHPGSGSVRVRPSGKQRSVTDGPFAETKELIGGSGFRSRARRP